MDIIVTFMFHNVFQVSSKVEVLISLFTFFQFYSVVSRDSKVDNFVDFPFSLLIIIRSGLLAEIRWSVCMSKSHRSLCVSFSRTVAGLCIYHLLAWSNFSFLYISQRITLHTQSCLALYSWANYYSLGVFHTGISWWSFIVVSKFPQIFRTLLSILAVLNNAVVSMISTCPLIF